MVKKVMNRAVKIFVALAVQESAVEGVQLGGIFPRTTPRPTVSPPRTRRTPSPPAGAAVEDAHIITDRAPVADDFRGLNSVEQLAKLVGLLPGNPVVGAPPTPSPSASVSVTVREVPSPPPLAPEDGRRSHNVLEDVFTPKELEEARKFLEKEAEEKAEEDRFLSAALTAGALLYSHRPLPPVMKGPGKLFVV